MRACIDCHERQPEPGSDTCFRCRVASVGLFLRGPAVAPNFHKTRSEHMIEHFGTADDRELGKKGIERKAS